MFVIIYSICKRLRYFFALGNQSADLNNYFMMYLVDLEHLEIRLFLHDLITRYLKTKRGFLNKFLVISKKMCLRKLFCDFIKRSVIL